MKKNFVLLLLFALLAGAVWWGSRTFFHMRHQLVTLDVRNASLADVLRSIARQTGTKIRAEQALNANITLNVKNQPLAAVLDRVAEQAGAHWSTLYAVYDLPQAINALDAALCGDGKLEPAGWTKIAPAMPPPPEPGDEAPGAIIQPSGAEPQGPVPGRRQVMVVRAGPDGPVMFAGGPKGQMEMWSP